MFEAPRNFRNFLIDEYFLIVLVLTGIKQVHPQKCL